MWIYMIGSWSDQSCIWWLIRTVTPLTGDKSTSRSDSMGRIVHRPKWMGCHEKHTRAAGTAIRYSILHHVFSKVIYRTISPRSGIAHMSREAAKQVTLGDSSTVILVSGYCGYISGRTRREAEKRLFCFAPPHMGFVWKCVRAMWPTRFVRLFVLWCLAAGIWGWGAHVSTSTEKSYGSFDEMWVCSTGLKSEKFTVIPSGPGVPPHATSRFTPIALIQITITS